MRYTSTLLILIATIALRGLLPAQQPAKTGRNKLQKSEEMISIYLNKTAILKLTKTEYRQFRDSINNHTKDRLHRINEHKIEWLPAIEHKSDPVITAGTTYYSIYRDDLLLLKLEKARFGKFKDSIANKTKDTLFTNADNRVDIHTYRPRTLQKKVTEGPAGAVFINARGYVSIHLPLARTHRYRIVFFDADDKHLFDIKTIKETDLVLDKTNFIHAGWFSYELYENDVLKEKNRLFLQKE